jgi:hypothetical protein
VSEAVRESRRGKHGHGCDAGVQRDGGVEAWMRLLAWAVSNSELGSGSG